jgi:hypothetical protein
MKFILGLVLASGSVPAWAQDIRAKQEGESTIRVVSEGRFETTFTKRKGFGATWFDLKHDPQKKHDLAPVLDENGLLWVKTAGQGADGSWYANPPGEMKLLEAGPTRVRVRLSGPHQRYGNTGPGAAWKDLGFAQTFTVYASGEVYADYALITEQPLALHHFVLVLKPNGAWGNRGKGAGANEVHCAGEFGPDKPAGPTASSFALQWTDGPTHFQDMLMVLREGKYKGSYWNEGYEDKDLRAGLDIMTRWPDQTLPKGADHISLLLCFRDDLNGHQAAAAYANDYRSPDRLNVSDGVLDTSDEGDRDADGFNEAEGCYVLKSAAKGVRFRLHGAKLQRMQPAFKVKGWQGAGAPHLTMDGLPLVQGADFQTSSDGGVLLVKLARIVSSDVSVSITAQESKPAPETDKDPESGFTPLFNGKDMTGWTVRTDDKKLKLEDVCAVADGVMTCTTKAYGRVYTEREYTDFVLKLEWRWPEQEKQARPPNSGVFFRLAGKPMQCYEAGLQFGATGDLWKLGRQCETDPKRTNKYKCDRSENCEKPVGQWNQYTITADGGDLTLEVNGKVVNNGTKAEVVPGNIGLQMEVGSIQFRNIRIKELTK